MLFALHNTIRKTPWLGRIALRSIPDLLWTIEVRPIGKMQIRLRQHRMYWLRPPLSQECFMLAALQRFVRPQDVVYDIGANIGLYSRFLVHCCGASTVYAFEPMENNRHLLKKNLELGGCTSRVSVVPIALGNADGTCEFQVDDLSSNSGTLDAVTHGKPSASRAQYGLPPRTVRVSVARLDSLEKSHGISTPDVIKLDVEGAEAFVLEGGKSVLSRHPCRLVIELHGPEVAKKVLNELWNLGYSCWGRLSREGKATYSAIVPDDLKYITDKYSLHHVLASRDPDELCQPMVESGTLTTAN
jgi:FkbM family methyltransferase